MTGDAAARDVQARIDPLLYTTPVDKAEHLGGRLLAAFSMIAVVLLAVPLGLVLAALVPGPDADLLGPFRPDAHLAAYLVLLLPNAFVATAFMFSMATLSRRAIVSYLGGVLLLAACVFSRTFVAGTLGRWELATLLDPLGVTALSELSMTWTPAEKSRLLVGLQGSLVWNRFVWIGIAVAVLALTHFRFRLAHYAAGSRQRRSARPAERQDAPIHGATAHVAPRVQRTFGVATHMRQALAVARESLQTIVTSWGAMALAVMAVALVVASGTQIEHMGVPLVATSARTVTLLSDRLTNPQEVMSLMIPLLVVFFAGELVWREQEARLNEIADAAPVPDWVSALGKFVGLSLALVAVQALMMGAGLLIQVLQGHYDFELALYGRILFGLQLPDYLLFALLALVVHVLVNNKYVGHLVVVMAYLFMAFGSLVGVEHHLLVYGSDPGWMYSDMRGFEPFIGPWLWFKLYWACVGAAAGGGGHALLGARQGGGRRFAAGLRPPPAHASSRGGCRGGAGARSVVRRLHLLQHERPERVPHCLGWRGAARGIRAALRTVQGCSAAAAHGHQPEGGDSFRPAAGRDPRHVPSRKRERGRDRGRPSRHQFSGRNNGRPLRSTGEGPPCR